jgi:hypothetical protein
MAFTAKPVYIPTFATTDYTDPGGRVNVTEPTTDEKEKGWQYLQKPGSNKMNWIHRGNYYWINYFNQFWNSSHQFLINDIDSEGGAGISILDIVKVDIINEYTGNAGVTIEGITLKDGYIAEPIGVNIAPVAGTNLHVHQLDSGISVSRFTNTTTTSVASHGTEFGINASEQGRIWNYENTDIVIGTNNTDRIHVTAGGGLAVGITTVKGTLGKVHIANGTNADTNWYAYAPLIVEGTDHTAINIRSANNKATNLIFSDPDATYSGYIGYNHNTDVMDFAVAAAIRARLNATGLFIGGAADPSNPLHVMSTTNPQVRIGYDAGSYWTFGVADAGNLTLSAGEATGRLDIKPGASNPTVLIYNTTATAILSILDIGTANGIDFSHNGLNGTIGARGGNIVITNTTECTGADTGALQVDGGADFAKHVNMQTNLTVGTGIIATTGDIVATAGYLQSGKGIYPVLILSGSYSINSVFDNLSPIIPNSTDKVVISCYIVDGDRLYCFTWAQRMGATTIRLFGLYFDISSSAGAITTYDIEDGGAPVIAISLSL